MSTGEVVGRAASLTNLLSFFFCLLPSFLVLKAAWMASCSLGISLERSRRFVVSDWGVKWSFVGSRAVCLFWVISLDE